MSPEFVVIDLSAISTFKNRDYTRFSNVVIPHEIACDILKSPDQRNYRRPFEEFFRANQSKIVVAHCHGTLEEMERGKRRIVGSEWIDEKTTAMLRNLNPKEDDEIDWDKLKNSDSFIRSRDSRISFLTFTEGFREELRQSDWREVEKEVQADGSRAAKEIKRPYYGRHLSRHLATIHPTYNEQFWNEKLSAFPDEYAVGRWSRIVCYYGLIRLTGATDFANNFDDAAYTFAASYAGGILAVDGDLKKCVQAVFPGVQTLSSGQCE